MTDKAFDLLDNADGNSRAGFRSAARGSKK